jgi:hypothetical protein
MTAATWGQLRNALRAEYIYDGFGHQLFRGDGAEWNDRRIAVRSSTVRIGVGCDETVTVTGFHPFLPLKKRA